MGGRSGRQAPNVQGFTISDAERRDLVAFLESLTDRACSTPPCSRRQSARFCACADSIVSCTRPIIPPGEHLMPSRRILVWAVAPIVAAVIGMACSADSSSATTLNAAAPVSTPR